jgi:GT2 family glycosyltransferase
MEEPATQGSVSVIVPTIGRAASLQRMLESLCGQSTKPDEVIIADGSSGIETESLINNQRWKTENLRIKRLGVTPPNAVRQRVAAIAEARSEYLLLLDDDVVLEPDCIEKMVEVLRQNASVVGVFANLNNQSWPRPTLAWRLYLRHILGMQEEEWQGRVVGPLLRFCYDPIPKKLMPMQWLSTNNTMIRRCVYHKAGGFSDFFLHRCTMNEDVDLGLKISKLGQIVFCPDARMAHFHDPAGRVSAKIAAEDDLYNRYLVMRLTQQKSAMAAFALVVLYFYIETISNLIGCLLRLRWDGFWSRLGGRGCALYLILLSKLTSPCANGQEHVSMC